MMKKTDEENGRYEIRLSGSGGQGLVLAAKYIIPKPWILIFCSV
jgi:hypothetical protein